MERGHDEETDAAEGGDRGGTSAGGLEIQIPGSTKKLKQWQEHYIYETQTKATLVEYEHHVNYTIEKETKYWT